MSSHHRNVVGSYRDANNHTAQINAVYGPGTTSCSATSARVRCWRSAATWSLHHQLSIGALVAFFLYLNRFFAPIQLLVQQYNTFQQGQSSVLKLRTLFATQPSTPEAADATRAAADRR